MSTSTPVPSWLEPLCQIARVWKTRDASVRDLFTGAAPDLSDGASFTTFVYARLRSSHELLDAWQGYSWDKRTAPSPYINGTEVGFFDGTRKEDMRIHENAAEACADFIYREAVWVIEGRRATPSVP